MLFGHYLNYDGWLWFSCILLGCASTIILIYYIVSLEEKTQLCRERGIDFQVSLKLPADLTVEPLHLCSVFADLMDNAIHGVTGSGQERPKITLSSKADGDYLFIKTVNPCAEPQKPDSPAARQGRGIIICTNIAEQYGGSYRGSFANGIYTALVSMLAN